MIDAKARTFLELVDDRDCSTILDAIQENPKTVKEISERCDIPLSTTYRKVNRLQEAGLVEEKIRLQSRQRPTSVYERTFEGAVITVDDDGEFAVEFVGSDATDEFVVDTPRPPVSIAEGD